MLPILDDVERWKEAARINGLAFEKADRQLEEEQILLQNANRAIDELRAKLEATQRVADEASANFFCERCGCSYCLEAEKRHNAIRAKNNR